VAEAVAPVCDAVQTAKRNAAILHMSGNARQALTLLTGRLRSSRPARFLLGVPHMKSFSRVFTAVMLASALLFVAGCSTSAGPRQTTGEYFDDSMITTKVKAAIFDDSTLRVTDVKVETYEGVVQLSGFVNSRSDINRAVELARSVRGVKSVKNDMRLK
jgi:osmotically-inducible protein OsmY